jgi:hypothetical protein
MDEPKMSNQPIINDSPKLSQTSQIPIKSTGIPFNKIIIFVIVFLGFILTGVAGYFFCRESVGKKLLIIDLTGKNQPIEDGTKPPSVDTEIKETPSKDDIPKINVLYRGVYNGKDAFFLTNKRLNVYYENGIKKTSPEVGSIVQEDSGSSQFRFSQITEPIEIATFDQLGENIEPGNFYFNPDKSKLYIFIETYTDEKNGYGVKQELYGINLTGTSKELLWSHDVGDKKYSKIGPAQIDQIEADKYIVLNLGICYGCEGFEPHGSIILNINSGKEVYVGEAGDFQFELNKMIVSYRKLKPFEEVCEPGYGCDNGTYTIYKPDGALETSNLP